MEKIDIGWNVTFPAVKTFLPRSACSGLPLRGKIAGTSKSGRYYFIQTTGLTCGWWPEPDKTGAINGFDERTEKFISVYGQFLLHKEIYLPSRDMVSQYNNVYIALMSAAGSCNYVWLSDRDSENPQNRLYFTSKGEIHGYIRQNPFCIAPCFFIKKDALVMTDILQCEVPDTLLSPSGKDLFGCLA